MIVGIAALIILLIVKEARKAHDLSMEDLKDRVFFLTHVRQERLKIESKDTGHYREIMLRMMLIKKAKLANSIQQEKETLTEKDMPAKIAWAKDFLSKQVCPEDLRKGLDDKQQLLLILCFKGYTPLQISDILEQALYVIESEITSLRNSMSKTGLFTSEQIDNIIDNQKAM